jgi:hypothetical protein
MAFLGNFQGSTPQMNRFPEGAGIKRLFHSEREIALIIDKTIKKGFGQLKAGTVLALDADGFCVPYVPATVVAGEDSAIGCVPILAVSDGVVQIPKGYGGVFTVDDILLEEGESTDITVSAITFGDYYDTITVDEYDALAAGEFLTIKGAETPKYILDQDVDTGFGEDAMGANASVVVSNAILYRNSLINMDAAAIAALGVVDGQFFILK